MNRNARAAQSIRKVPVFLFGAAKIAQEHHKIRLLPPDFFRQQF